MESASEYGPVIQRALLTRELVKLRKSYGMTQEAVAHGLDWSHAKVMRLESGKQGIKKADLMALLHLYGADEDKIGRNLKELATLSKTRAWWDKYREDVSEGYLRYVGYEAGAATIKHSQTAVIPGLLQTRPYAEEVARLWAPDRSKSVVDIRMARQGKIRERSNPPEEVYVLDEAVIHRWVGGDQKIHLMLEQIEHLISISEEPNISLHVIPFGSGFHGGLKGPFTILGFHGDLEDVLYMESRRTCEITFDPKSVAACQQVFGDLIENHALDCGRSRTKLKQVLEDMRPKGK
jgi:transcriptional regulator with XRE-family HTH domain